MASNAVITPCKPLPRISYVCASGKRHGVTSTILAHQKQSNAMRRVGPAAAARVVLVFTLDKPHGVSLHYLRCKCGAYILAKEGI